VVPSWNCGRRDPREVAARPELGGWKTQLYEANLWISYNGPPGVVTRPSHFP
jgi:hypothetical protein